MKVESPLSVHLQATKLCDFEHPAVRDRSRELVREASLPKDIALEVFYFVRDAIPFDATLDIWEKASETLDKRVNDYCNKVNLQIALLRAAGIPARCHLVQVRKEVLKVFIPRFIYNRLPSPVGHFWCECCLDERWIACETLFDEPLYRGMLSAGLVSREQMPTIDWDGESDLILFEAWIVSDEGIHPAFDDILASPMMSEAGMPPKILCKLLDPIPMFLSRRRTDRIRERAVGG
ncbi:MAG: transglutaminase-like domain-containing protein [Anaerolineae bacterium]|jgi:transglutaminase-like putative cysteine protease